MINGQPVETTPETNNVGADDTTKTNAINALLAGEEEPKKISSHQVAEKNEISPDPELAFDTDQPPVEPGNKDAGLEVDAAAVDNDEEAKPVTLADVAESLELDSKDLYEIEIPIGQGDDAVSLGQLKDSHKELTKLNATRAAYDEHRTKSENELLVSRRQVAQLIHMGQSSGMLTDDVINQINNIHSTNLARERTALMSSIPEWQDAATRDNDFEGIVDFLGGYGIQRNEIEQSMDHRLVKVIHDTVKRLNAVKAAKEAAKVPKSIRSGGRKGGGAKTPLQIKFDKAKGGSQHDKRNAVDALLQNLN